MNDFKIIKFPKSRIATIDVCEIGQKKHHIAALIEIDVTESRQKIKKYRKEVDKISFNAWLIKAISRTINDHVAVTAFLNGKRKVIIFDDINISIIVEKQLNGQKIPIPLIIEKANERSIESITKQIKIAKEELLTKQDIVLQSRQTQMEKLYYLLPGFLRRIIWKQILKTPRFAFHKMGNVAITSIGNMGNATGWFIPTSIHPICFGISKISKKPVVVRDKIEIREILNMTILLDHDVIDGAPMARFISDLSENIEKGIDL